METEFTAYMKKRGVTEEQLREARERTQNMIDAYNLKRNGEALPEGKS